jgi:S-adenosylmethionine:tRNA ribosyltransferase-isomerase
MEHYAYDLPDGAIAQVPVEPRDRARLLDATGPDVEHRTVAGLPELVGPGDVLVVNDTKVLPARLALRKSTGGQAEVLLLEPIAVAPAPGETAIQWRALVRPGRRLAPGTVLLGADDRPVVRVGDRLGDGCRAVELLDDPWRHGTIPLPPYIHAPLSDPDRYQTVYATHPGSVAAPTAGLHLTADVLRRCRERGATVATVDLGVGLDTFRPITVEQPADHVIHSEPYDVPVATIEACGAARRVIAVGTTTVRALESAAATGQRQGRTSLFIHDDYPFAVVDVLLTNFHLPRSSLLLLVEAFAGPRWRALYDVALAEGYRFLSFGDAMIVTRADGGRR